MIYILVSFVSFLVGAIVGIKDCKKRFRIPKKAVELTENGYIYR